MSGIKYQIKLDGLRFVAVFMVLVEHFAYYIGQHFSAGFYGVNLFFVISGFLITSILIKNRNSSFKTAYIHFIGRRALRIFPIYYLILFILAILGGTSIFRDLPYLISYTYNYHLENINGWSEKYSLYWSLSVEEQFYLFFPLIVISLRGKTKYLIVVCLFLIGLAFAQVYFDIFSIAKYNYVGLLSNMGPLALGALGAVVVRVKGKRYFLFESLIIELIVFGVLIWGLITVNYSNKLLLCSITNLFFVLKAYHFSFKISWINNFLSNSKVVFAGRVSYGIYVYHGIIAFYFTKYIFDPIWHSIPFEDFGKLAKIEFHNWIFKLPIYTLVAIAVASLSFKYLEMPVLKLKDKYFSN